MPDKVEMKYTYKNIYVYISTYYITYMCMHVYTVYIYMKSIHI